MKYDFTEESGKLREIAHTELERLTSEHPQLARHLQHDIVHVRTYQGRPLDQHYGYYNPYGKSIVLNEFAAEQPTPAAKSTLRHEIGHALDYSVNRTRDGHLIGQYDPPSKQKLLSNDPRFLEEMVKDKIRGRETIERFLATAQELDRQAGGFTTAESDSHRRKAAGLRQFFEDSNYYYSPRELFADACAILYRPKDQQDPWTRNRERMLHDYAPGILRITETLLKEQGML